MNHLINIYSYLMIVEPTITTTTMTTPMTTTTSNTTNSTTPPGNYVYPSV